MHICESWSRHRPPKASPTYNLKYFYSFFALSFNSIFYFFFDWSGPVRVLVPSYRSPRHWAKAETETTIHRAEARYSKNKNHYMSTGYLHSTKVRIMLGQDCRQNDKSTMGTPLQQTDISGCTECHEWSVMICKLLRPRGQFPRGRVPWGRGRGQSRGRGRIIWP